MLAGAAAGIRRTARWDAADAMLRPGQAGGLRAGALDLFDGLRRPGGQDFVTGGGDENVILDAHADTEKLARDRVGDLGRLGLLLVLQLLRGGHAEAEAPLPHLFLAVLAQGVGRALAFRIEVEAGLDGEDHARRQRPRLSSNPIVADV